MKKNYYQSQYILNQVFNNQNDIIRTTFNTSQDYLNAVYDNSKDALRISIDGGALPAVPSVDDLPLTAADGQICPVLNQNSGCLDFYEWDVDNGQWVYRGSTVVPGSGGGTGGGGGAGSILTPDEQIALDWVTQHLDQLKQVADFNYIVNVEEITLPANSTEVIVQGAMQNIDDDLNGDNDDKTPYRIDITGYVMSVSTYASNDAIVPDRYYTRITYEATSGGLGVSHIFMQQQEYQYFSNLSDGKNILKIYYITNATTSPIKHIRYTMNPDKTITDADGNTISALDTNNGDGDENTICCIKCSGYVLGIQTYESDHALVTDRYYNKIVYESDGIHSGTSFIYIDSDQWNYFSQLNNNKNIVDIYYVATVFPASLTISETQYQLPISQVGYVAVDAYGNVHNIEDIENKDGDAATHIKITVNGYVLDMDGYYDETDTIKKRLIVKMSYNPTIDNTDIYLDKDYYDYVSNLSDGKNIISVYSVGAGIGTDVSRIQAIDDSLDVNSEKAIQNKVVTQAIQTLESKISQLQSIIDELKNN